MSPTTEHPGRVVAPRPPDDVDSITAMCAAHAPVQNGGRFQAGTVFGDWRVTAFIGRGGNGEVYCAEHVTLGTPAAVKVLIRKEERAKERFLREAKLLAKMKSDAFPRFLAYGETYLAMELLEPGELPTGDRAVARFMLKVCEAVGELHALGYVHRDIKPGNILWRSGGPRARAAAVPVLADLGLIKDIGTSDTRLQTSSATLGGVGTPGYGAPEQMERDEATPASDIHSLGVLADRCFNGSPPRAWRRIIERATSSISAHRYPSVSAFARAIRLRNFPLLAVLCVSAAITLGVGAIFVSPDDHDVHLSANNDDFIAGDYTNWYARAYGESQLQQEELCRQRATRAISEVHRISGLRNSGKPVKEDDYVWLEGELTNIVEKLRYFNERWSEIRKRHASSWNSLDRAVVDTKPITIQLLEMWEREIRSCLDTR